MCRIVVEGLGKPSCAILSSVGLLAIEGVGQGSTGGDGGEGMGAGEAVERVLLGLRSRRSSRGRAGLPTVSGVRSRGSLIGR